MGYAGFTVKFQSAMYIKQISYYECVLQAFFLGNRGMVDNDYVGKLLDCMFFTTFVTERGPPWRVCDLWDDVYANIGDQLRQEQHDNRKMLENIQVRHLTRKFEMGTGFRDCVISVTFI